MRWPWTTKPVPPRTAYKYECECCGWRCVMRYEQDIAVMVQEHLASDWHRDNADA